MRTRRGGEQLSRRELVIRRFRGMCFYCSRALEPGEMTLDHWRPRMLGGRRTLGNLVLACRWCNTAKGRRDPGAQGVACWRQHDGAMLLFREQIVTRSMVLEAAWLARSARTTRARRIGECAIEIVDGTIEAEPAP